MINVLINKKKDYVTNASLPLFLDGLDVEIINFKSLIPSIKSFEIKSKNWLKYKTLI